MYHAIDPQPSNARAWLAAASEVQRLGGDAHNVVIDIADPLAENDVDTAIMNQVNQFLRAHNVNTLPGVANTIFPLSTFERHGPEDFYGVYRKEVFPRMKQMTRDWGRYFDRLTEWKKVSKGKVELINPLKDLVAFMRCQIESNERTYRNAYEMTIYDPARDAGKVANRQCLSFLSFKLTNDNRLLLTVMYRNHAYIARGLGNFIGLGRLQGFVAQQAGAQLGSLTCISTHAEIDNGKRKRDDVVEGWTLNEANALINSCRSLLPNPA
jgi:thymidylate synthase